jgi:hypothetical protein
MLQVLFFDLVTAVAGRQSALKFTRDEARRIAAKLPELLRGPAN